MRKYIHIGLPKCASSSLQQFWNEQPDVYFAGKVKGNYKSEILRSTIRQAVAGVPGMAFDPNACAAVIAESIEDAKRSGFDCYVLSDEILSGMGFIYAFSTAPDGGEICSRILKLFGDDTVFILVIREQLSFLKSYWHQLIVARYPLTFYSFIESQLTAQIVEGRSVPQWNLLPSLHYDRYLRTLRAAGAKVVAAPMEFLVRDQRAFSDFIGQLGFPGGDFKLPHANQSKDTAIYRRKLSQNMRRLDGAALRVPLGDWQMDIHHKRDKGLGPEDVLYDAEYSDSQSARLADMFAASNRALAQETGIDLASLGYRV